jgi:hypothetical protein
MLVRHRVLMLVMLVILWLVLVVIIIRLFRVLLAVPACRRLACQVELAA